MAASKRRSREASAVPEAAAPALAVGQVEGDEPMYLIEMLCGKKVVGRSVMYKVKWLGYPMSQCTWEPAANLPEDYIHVYEEDAERKTLTPSAKAAATLSTAAARPLFAKCFRDQCRNIELAPGAVCIIVINKHMPIVNR